MLRRGEELMLMPQGKAEVRKGFLPAGHNVAQLVMCLTAQVIVFHHLGALEHLLIQGKVGWPGGSWVCCCTPDKLVDCRFQNPAEVVDGTVVCGALFVLKGQ